MSGFCELFSQNAKFQTDLLESIARKIQFIPKSEQKNVIIEIGILNNNPLYAIINDKGVVSHIGFRFFSDELMSENRVALEFIERYFLELSLCNNDYNRNQKMQDDKFIFLLGNYHECFSLIKGADFKLSKVDDRYYKAIWSKNGEDNLTIAFPISYELLTGMPLNEIQKTLYKSVKESTDSLQFVEDYTDMIKLDDSIYVTNPVRYYEFVELVDSRYYVKNANLDFSAVYDSSYIDYSIANLFHIPRLGYGRELQIEQLLYGFRSITFTINVSEWVIYCLNEKMNIYFAVEKETTEYIKAVVLAENKNLGYNHLLSVVVPKKIISNSDLKLTATLNAFIPTHNIQNLYQEYKYKRK